MNGRGDGAEFNFYSKYINIKALGTWTGWLAKDDNPYGLSDRDILHRRKAGIRRREAVHVMVQPDPVRVRPGPVRFRQGALQSGNGMLYGLRSRGNDVYCKYYGQKTHYESQYYGAGLEGVIVSGLSYSGEFIMERGKLR